MTVTEGNPDMADALRARNLLVREVRDTLKGQRYDIREWDRDLSIGVPQHPERGRVHVTYASGEVSVRRVVWGYLGYLGNHGGDRSPDTPRVDAAMIIRALSGEDSPDDGTGTGDRQ
jgi:hypothetical protein